MNLGECCVVVVVVGGGGATKGVEIHIVGLDILCAWVGGKVHTMEHCGEI